jgi:ATP synthase protein I
MQTTDTATPRTGAPRAGRRPFVVAALVTTVVGALLVAVAALVAGSPAAYGALAGSAMVVVVLAFGAFVVDLAARVAPATSLLVALVTYTLQVGLMALLFVAVRRADVLASDVERGWLGGTVIAGALVWSVVQLRASMTTRIPVYATAGEQAAGRSDQDLRQGAEGDAR